jgi:predicted transcriptional regulator
MADLKGLTANIVSGFVANTKVEADQLPKLIASVSSVLDGLGKADASSESDGGVTKLTPAQIRKSFTDAGIVSFEDGKTYKSMKRSLSRYGLSPDAYRAKWGLAKQTIYDARGFNEKVADRMLGASQAAQRLQSLV